MQLISGQLVSAYTALLHSIVNRQEMLDTVTYTYKWSHIIFFLTQLSYRDLSVEVSQVYNRFCWCLQESAGVSRGLLKSAGFS